MLQANQLTCDKATVSTVVCDLIMDGQSGQNTASINTGNIMNCRV